MVANYLKNSYLEPITTKICDFGSGRHANMLVPLVKISTMILILLNVI